MPFRLLESLHAEIAQLERDLEALGGGPFGNPDDEAKAAAMKSLLKQLKVKADALI